ncbi:MAG TPA: RNA polymerase sigma factor [Verrucomicrobiota bacterium]|nr:RNA polymerase sigma factor [Verrucomicrobiota bacterium]
MNQHEQFEQFVRRYQNMVYTTAMRLLANNADAQDIAQEVFIKAYQRFPDFNGISNIAAWLRRVAINFSLNHLTRYRNRLGFFSELSTHVDDNEFAFDYPDQNVKTVEDIEKYKIIEELVSKLPARQRVPLVLFHFEGLSYEEIAEQLGASLGKIKTDIHRGRIELQKQVQLHFNSEDGIKPEKIDKEILNRQNTKEHKQQNGLNFKICYEL